MRINNIGEFKTFLTDNRLDNLDSTVADFVACVLQYNILCSCKKAQKAQKHEICNQQYIHAVSTTLTTNKNLLFANVSYDSIEFYYNQNYHIATLSR
jgi:hypothetical protein